MEVSSRSHRQTLKYPLLGIISQNGQNVVIDPSGVKWLVGEHDPIELDVAEWHEYTIIAKGTHLVQSVCDNTLEHLIG